MPSSIAAAAAAAAAAVTTSKDGVTVPTCHIDSTILNTKTLADMDDIGLSFFASVCGKNRGAFVLDPPDGQTYGCLQFPTNFTEMLGITDLPTGVTIGDANAIKDQYIGQNITASEALTLLNFLVERSYESSPTVDTNPYGCDVNGLAQLSCGTDDTTKDASSTPRKDGQPIRSVNLIGLLIENEQSWLTSRIEYTSDDYQHMIDMGLNTVQIAVPTSVFNSKDSAGKKLKSILDTTLQEIADAAAAATTGNGDGALQVILSLVSTGDELNHVVTASAYAKLHKDIVLGLTLPYGMNIASKTVVDSIRATESDGSGPALSIFLPYTVGDLLSPTTPDVARDIDDRHVYGSVSWTHITTVGDIASSTSQEDRSKMFYHESVACTMRSPLEHNHCFGSKIPIFWSSGFDLAIDDCAAADAAAMRTNSPTFKDYGQCDRFDETIESDWWSRHRASFAARQLYAAEMGGLGWSYSSWKLHNKKNDDDVGGSTSSSIDHPVQLLALREVDRAGLFPDLTTTTTIPAHTSCLNPPVNDFILGDDTLSPTMGPLPDCGNGWWNATTSQCDYWIPPPEPTMSPTEACPVCDVDCSTAHQTSTGALVMAGVGGAAAVLVLGVIHKYCFAKKKNDYSPIPN